MTRLLAGSGLDMVLRSDGSYTLVQRRVTLEETTIDGIDTRSDSLPPVYPGAPGGDWQPSGHARQHRRDGCAIQRQHLHRRADQGSTGKDRG